MVEQLRLVQPTVQALQRLCVPVERVINRVQEVMRSLQEYRCKFSSASQEERVGKGVSANGGQRSSQTTVSEGIPTLA